MAFCCQGSGQTRTTNAIRFKQFIEGFGVREWMFVGVCPSGWEALWDDGGGGSKLSRQGAGSPVGTHTQQGRSNRAKIQSSSTVKGKAEYVVKKGRRQVKLPGLEIRELSGRSGSQVGVRIVQTGRQVWCRLSRRSDNVDWKTGLFIQGMVNWKCSAAGWLTRVEAETGETNQSE